MRCRAVVNEDYTNYKVPAMFIGCISCDGKCCTEGGFSPSVCINHEWTHTTIEDVDDEHIISDYLSNPITHAIVFGLLEPMLQYDEIREFIYKLRRHHRCFDDVVIYTGYYKNEIEDQVKELSSSFENIIIKFGRFIPDKPKRFDDVLGVWLASDNQYAEVVSQ